jgi:hypothetical protein
MRMTTLSSDFGSVDGEGSLFLTWDFFEPILIPLPFLFFFHFARHKKII